MKNYVLYLFAVLGLFSCTENAPKNSETSTEQTDGLDSLKMLKPKVYALSDEVLEGILNSIPSPLEFSDKLKDKNVGFDKSLLINIKKSDDLVSGDEKALAMGIYGTDLSYINIYKETALSAQYYEILVKLSKDLMLDQFFNVSTIDLLKSNENNKEKLLSIIRARYKDIHEYLKNQKRDEISAMILYGSWIESFYITLRLQNGQQIDLKELVSEQKIAVNKFMAIFNSLPESSSKNKCLSTLNQLQEVYQQVELSYIFKNEINTEDTLSEPELNYESTKNAQVNDEVIKKLLSITVESRNNLFN